MTDSLAPISDRLRATAEALEATLIPRVNRFRERQEDDGSVATPTSADVELLTEIKDEAHAWYHDHGLDEQAQALVLDVEAWIGLGLDHQPDFARSRDALRPPADGAPVFFLAPLRSTNSAPPAGKRLDCFLALRREPVALPELNETHPHPKNNCQSLVLLTGSAGFTYGNCLVFFPENVAAHDKVKEQAYAMFFFNKMRKIHETYAVPGAAAVLTAGSLPRASASLNPDVCYEARAIWGYLHDRMHFQGAWPLDQNISLKMNWFVGLLEEIKVDAKTILTCSDSQIPHAHEQIDMILLERVFRYPLADDATANFDSGTGVLLYSWLREHGALTGSPDGGQLLHLDRDRTIEALRAYVHTVERLEETVTTEEEYKHAAKRFVRAYLPPGEPGARYRFTEDQLTLLRAREELADLPLPTFALAEW